MGIGERMGVGEMMESKGEVRTWTRAERENGAGEERRWRGCLRLIICLVTLVGRQFH